jgi:hypothetical protein
LADPEYTRAIDLACEIAAEIGIPRFYREREREVSLSRELFDAEPLVASAVTIVEGRGDCLGHGLSHVRKVAVDMGALIVTEEGRFPPDGRIRRLVFLAHLTGLFHDICRDQRDHAERGADEASKLLASFPIGEDERAGITGAIRNHEAFRPRQVVDGPAARLLSDALYDADKFRWGPDNFTETLWAMIIPRGIPLPELLPRFLTGLDGIANIRESFRTVTGREYGPDFIDRGLAIGRRLHAELNRGF